MSANPPLLPCDACGEGQLHPKTAWDAVEYKAQHGKIRHHYSVCDVCGSELANAQQMLENKRELIRFRKQVDDVPFGNQIAAMRKRFNLTQAQAGQLFGGGPVAFCKYEHDDILPDEAMSNLLYLAITYEDTVYKLAGRKNVSLPHSVQIDYEFEWLRDEQHDPNGSFPLVNEFHKIMMKTSHEQALRRRVPSANAAKMELTFGNGWNGEKQSWTM